MTMPMAADPRGVTGQLYVGDLEAAVPPRQPGVSEVIVLETERLVTPFGIDVVGPHRAALEEVLIAVDDRGHGAPPASFARVWHEAAATGISRAPGSPRRRGQPLSARLYHVT
jgi:hypothetical protein